MIVDPFSQGSPVYEVSQLWIVTQAFSVPVSKVDFDGVVDSYQYGNPCRPDHKTTYTEFLPSRGLISGLGENEQNVSLYWGHPPHTYRENCYPRKRTLCSYVLFLVHSFIRKDRQLFLLEML